MKRPAILGILGGVASGKTEVTRILEAHGAYVIHADRIGHEVLTDPDIIETLVHEFGREILDPNSGQIDRSRVAALVFGADEKAIQNRRRLESVVHPRIRRRISDALDRACARDDLAIVVLDVPLLLESGWIDACDRVWFVDAPEAARRARAVARGWSSEQFAQREASQSTLDIKRSRATDVVDNSGSLAQLTTRVESLVESLLGK